jgi:C4-dicarboxylate-specific signal transduction histidine kinase
LIRRADAVQVRQALTNLEVNAGEATAAVHQRNVEIHCVLCTSMVSLRRVCSEYSSGTTPSAQPTIRRDREVQDEKHSARVDER